MGVEEFISARELVLSFESGPNKSLYLPVWGRSVKSFHPDVKS